MWPIGSGQIQTSSQAGGIASSRMRSITRRLGDPAPVLVEVLEAFAAPPPADAGTGAVHSLESRHGGLMPARGGQAILAEVGRSSEVGAFQAAYRASNGAQVASRPELKEPLQPLEQLRVARGEHA